MKRSAGIRDKIRAKIAKLRKRPTVTKEQKLQCRVDTLTSEAQELNAGCMLLQEKSGDFVTRAETTKLPEAPPPDREALFQRDANAPPSQYEVQVKAHTILVKDWHAYEQEVAGFSKKLDKFTVTVENLKKEGLKPGPMGKTEHDFESLDNAIFNLKKQRVALSESVAAVPLPVL